MAFVEIIDCEGKPQKVRVCDYCRAVCCTSRFCSGHCARNYFEFKDQNTAQKVDHAEAHEDEA